ncbi:MAG: FAD-binding oxidoreductase [Leptospiraceae bacterium]|nr:FAD-binding oxidoreductase [Leptospiraceae bacterium]
MKYKRATSTEHISALRACLPAGRVIVRDESSSEGSGLNEAEFLEYGRDRLAQFHPDFDLLLLPDSSEEVIAAVRYCKEHNLTLVPSGGRTGLAGGAVAGQGEIVLSLGRMNRVLEFQPRLPAIRCEAGVITAELQRYAAEQGFCFPLDLAAAGSSQIGGNIATNAGGTRVIRYGMLRDWIVGLKVVTGAGDVLTFPGGILKNNTGPDLKHAFIGSEGIYGIILEATIRLAIAPRQPTTVLIGVPDIDVAQVILQELRRQGMQPLAFEFFDQGCLEIVREHLNVAEPFREPVPGYVLLEWDAAEFDFDDAVTMFAGMEERHLIRALRPATSSTQSAELWRLREGISESISMTRHVRKYDVSLPAECFAGFQANVIALCRDMAHVYPVFFGHLGDGNLHVNIVSSGAESRRTGDTHEFMEDTGNIDMEIYKLIGSLNGSISAEHGIGLLKKDYLHLSRSAVEIDYMRQLKSVFDPAGILNPGKVIPD